MRMRKRKWVDPFLQEEKEFLINDALAYNDIFLEIGMGMGDFIIESAILHPERMYIGLEKDPTCVARAIKKAKDSNVNNLKIICKNAINLIEIFKEKSVNTIYLHFSDPWPKKAHHKRRLTYPTFLTLYEKILVDYGGIIFKTDNKGLYEDSIEYFKASNFKILEINEDYHSIIRNEPMTGYERKFKNEGFPIYFIKLEKKC